ncbi:septum formation family protein [Paenarthrobacter sp. S56]|uniref:septum formation family protein n=1 Tax=Paenarthrobacter sp. S56 TaxID=3138179 RepID=UPI00321A3353
MSQDNTPPRDEPGPEHGPGPVPPARNVPSASNVPPPPPFAPSSGFHPEGFQQPDEGQQQAPPSGDPVKRQRLVIGGIVVGALVLMGVVIWVLLNLLGARPEAAAPTPSASASLGPLPRDTDSKDFQVGDCFANFDPNASKARAVACDTEHTAQLGAAYTYPQDNSFPGTNALKEKGREVCTGIKFNAAANEYTTLLKQAVYPSTSSWERGDRRVDCFIVVNPGNTIKDDLLQK